jgi:Mrp family chromosome partitioning ATPase
MAPLNWFRRRDSMSAVSDRDEDPSAASSRAVTEVDDQHETDQETTGDPTAPSLDDLVGDVGEEWKAEGPHSFARPLPRVVALANQKGGVGKTTTAVNLGASLAEMGSRVLLIDLDPQGNATTGLGINARNLELSIYDVILREVPLEDCIEPTSLKNLFLAPATIDLAGAEIELVPSFSRELKLRRALETVLSEFDYILIDCPPSLGLITVNALAAAGEVLVPIQCEYYALEGLLRRQGVPQRGAEDGQAVGGPLLRPAHHHLRPHLARRARLPRAGQGGERWRDVAASVGASGR